MRKILIVSGVLTIGGSEKLVYELVRFARANQIEPVVLILNNYNEEYYDDILKKMAVKVVRTRISDIQHFRAPSKMLRSIIWSIKLKFFAEKLFSSVHVIGLYNVDKVLDIIIHKHRFFWNVTNAIQYSNREYTYTPDIFANKNDTIVCINKYQVDEMHQQYGAANIGSKIVLFKLFVNK